MIKKILKIDQVRHLQKQELKKIKGGDGEVVCNGTLCPRRYICCGQAGCTDPNFAVLSCA
ncbi:hypothetical protein SAMN04487910_4277 [Aquimarina amphilecti]|uniref:Uncharacterized protein n=1 Tax=Aquimarina amphilecti TaxID=1038014 RepID=A0A1H7W0D0_AQUAM|nr:hypothetical protein SAMN04487910_4277 [Aquimarina amphilecti]